MGASQTFGQLIHAHPHIHALVTEGVFLPDGTFLPLPRLATELFLVSPGEVVVGKSVLENRSLILALRNDF